MNINLFLLPVTLSILLSCSSNPTNSSTKEEASLTLKAVEKSIPTSQPTVPLEYLMGKFDPATDDQFELIDKQYADREGLFLHKETYAAFKKMWAAAKADGINFVIRSATRNFDYQKGIWERKWNGNNKVEGKNLAEAIPDPKYRAEKILEFSSMPGTSRHHWGTDLDVNSFDNSYFESGNGLKEFEWLEKNAESYGFCRPYTAKDENRPFGYNEEKWHWSYMPLSTTFTRQAELHLKDEMIQGFDGAETAQTIQVVKHYVLGINKECLK